MTRAAASALALVLLAAACGGGPEPVVPPSPAPPAPQGVPRITPLADADLLLVPADGSVPATDLPVVRVEVVATHAARQRGLGGRETLPDGRGMLFVYPASRGRTFWMKDCLVALDIAFLDEDGRILNVATLPPGAGLFGGDVPSAESAGPALYVLEVRARWLGEHGLGAGDRVDVTHVVRGVDAE